MSFVFNSMKVSDLWIKDSQRKTNISEANNKIFISIALSPNSTYLAGMNRLIICDRLALLQSLISSTR
ncbi:hypothetical protein NMY3_00907 [Candidatus Nitrosocosmicus oleophilus]|uniref:Uncharacterized protein n=1 Tax=Candidatus Nitrosocosmicus oleophilus TaxID=1353260 RepID=A0A654LXH6_9ARCH|nr:hypothetical protein NMY3_00907 [Candidatus Nitrosocosmicus oleophilus]